MHDPTCNDPENEPTTRDGQPGHAPQDGKAVKREKQRG
jgi:hypothetical protein